MFPSRQAPRISNEYPFYFIFFFVRNIRCRDEMLAGLHKLDESMDVFVSSVKQLRSMDTSQEELKEQQETLKNAISNSSHPLHSVQAKYVTRGHD